jgi:hypothetical protein
MRRIVTSWHILKDALREIFDEAAYARFLQRAEMKSSAEAYEAFLHESEDGKVRRPKCC